MPKKDPKSDGQPKSENRYVAIIEKIFFDHWKEGLKEFDFTRTEIDQWADKLGVERVKNIGDLLYFFRFRHPFPEPVLKTEESGKKWQIHLAGRAQYKFKLAKESRIVPHEGLDVIKIPNATPQLIGSYALDDEQALLAIVRYNRLVDIFLGLTTYSLQNHLRTTVKGIGQIEIDELYIGVDGEGGHHVIPVQAKGGKDQISVVQTHQDLAACAEKFSGVECHALSVQFMDDSVVAMFELAADGEDIKIAKERHYKLVTDE